MNWRSPQNARHLVCRIVVGSRRVVPARLDCLIRRALERIAGARQAHGCALVDSRCLCAIPTTIADSLSIRLWWPALSVLLSMTCPNVERFRHAFDYSRYVMQSKYQNFRGKNLFSRIGCLRHWTSFSTDRIKPSASRTPTIIYIALRNPEIGGGIEIIGCFPAAAPPKTRRISESRSGGISGSRSGIFSLWRRGHGCRQQSARHPTEKAESVRDSPITAPSTSTPA